MTGDATAIYGTSRPLVDARYDPADGGPGLAEVVIDAIAKATGVSPTDMPPIYHIVDLDALSVVLGSSEADGEQLFAFQYDGLQVFVSGDGRVRVCDPDAAADPSPIFGQ